MSNDAVFERAQLPRPDVTESEAAEILNVFYGLEGDIRELGSQQDRNYLVDTGTSRHVLKICRTEYATVELEAQNEAMHHLARKANPIRVPKPLPAVNGDEILFLAVAGVDYQVRVLTYLDGEPLTGHRHLSHDTVAALGDLAGRLAADLADFRHPGLERELQWDLRRAAPVGLQLLSAVSDQGKRDRIAKAMVGAVKRMQPLTADLRTQPVHHDVTDDNIVAIADRQGRLIPDGVIDFGDILNGWLVAELATACSSLLHHAGGDPFYILPAVRAFHAVNPLNEAELKALWPLIVCRAAILVASSEQQLAIDPDNAYVAGNIAHEREIFDTAASVPLSLMEAAILDAVGFAPPPFSAAAIGPLLPGITPETFRFIELDVLSQQLTRGHFTRPGIEEKLLQNAARETGISASLYGEYRLTLSGNPGPRAPENFALHVDICLPAGFQVAAPFDGRIEIGGEHVVLIGDGIALHLDGTTALHSAGLSLTLGEPLATVTGEAGGFGLLRIQLSREPGLRPPLFCAAPQAGAWGRLSPSPAIFLGVDCDGRPPESSALLDIRDRHFARPQKHYYAKPPQFERGWKEHMFDLTGRAYLDMVNNVTILGHGHPRLADAVHRQWSMLNTNSRFHYAAVAEFSERLAALAPEGLDTVFLVNSGSEANDLALRLAWAATGAKNMLCLLEGYHGWSVASDAVSTSIADNPQALATRPAWVHAVTSPNTFRGLYRSDSSTEEYLATVTPVLEALDASGEKLAGFICEPVYGNAGGIPLPPGYLEGVYAMVRARGGICIADEVQVGYGRLGHHFWGFEQQGVTPDIITVAKGMGNGHPLGAVITTRAIADALESEGYFFSSSGGSPVSCVVGMTVLDILADEDLIGNARTTGDHLKARLLALKERFPLVGEVHGMGLYLGVEFIRDRELLTPATEETAAICERLLDLGVIMQPTGDYLNVLKIKPPLCLSIESADYFVEAVEKVLSEGW